MMWKPHLALMACAATVGACSVDPSTLSTEAVPTTVSVTSDTTLPSVSSATSVSNSESSVSSVPVSETAGSGALSGMIIVEGMSFCDLAQQSMDLVKESETTSNVEPYERAQAALVEAMVARAPAELTNTVTPVYESYANVLAVLRGERTLRDSERSTFWQTHNGLTSLLQLELAGYFAGNCTRRDLGFATAERDEGDASTDGGGDELAAPAAPAPPSSTSSTSSTTASAPAVTSTSTQPPSTQPPSQRSEGYLVLQPGRGTDPEQSLPLAAAGVPLWEAPDLPSPASHNIPLGRFAIASLKWEATPSRPAVILDLHVHVSPKTIVLGAGCTVSAADYERQDSVAIDIVQNHGHPTNPESFSSSCGMDNGYFSLGSAWPYFYSSAGWWTREAVISATFVERATGLTATLETTFRFADYWR